MVTKAYSIPIKEYLEQVVAHKHGLTMPGLLYSSMEAFVLAHGRSFPSHPFPSKFKRGAMKECFRNAQMLAQDHDLIYVEGYAAGVIPTLHGWCADKEGNVIDPTWTEDMGHEYYGVPFKLEYAIEKALLANTFGLIDRWEDHWPLLREPDTSKFLFSFK